MNARPSSKNKENILEICWRISTCQEAQHLVYYLIRLETL